MKHGMEEEGMGIHQKLMSNHETNNTRQKKDHRKQSATTSYVL
jgi:hypothetical protein